jgi:oligopeptide transport system ATP-binding protein
VTEHTPLLSVRNVTVSFYKRRNFPLLPPRGVLTAVRDVSFDLTDGQTLGVVGESGCGKSTLGKAVLRLVAPRSGEIVWKGRPIGSAGRAEMRDFRRDVQVIFQDPLAALDPRMTVGDQVDEPLRIHRPELGRAERTSMVEDMLAKVGIRPDMMGRYPHEFSGGQAQRISIARALILRPQLIVCDEPVSALDVSIQAQIINLLLELRREFGLSLLFISHDLAVVRRLSDRIMVLYLGKVMEESDRDTLFADARHPYTRALLASVPVPDPARARASEGMILHGDLPSPLSPPSGCVFRTRCPKAQALCADVEPELRTQKSGHRFACHFPHDGPPSVRPERRTTN